MPRRKKVRRADNGDEDSNPKANIAKKGRGGGKKNKARSQQDEEAHAAELQKRKDQKKKTKLDRQLNVAPDISHSDAIVTVDETQGEVGDTDCIQIKDFSLSFRGEDLLTNATLKIVKGHKYGLVGVNGSGKSTLLRHIAERKLPRIPKSMHILHVEQEAKGEEISALESVLQSDSDRLVHLKEKKEIETELKDNTELSLEDSKAKQARLQEIYEHLDAIGANSATARAAMILSGLQFTPKMQQQPTKEFSGGWRMRIALARALFCKPDLLLLDEPTNHLDLHALIWLEGYLEHWKKTVLVVSHDRNFLNSVCTDIISLSQKKLSYFRGNFNDYEVNAEQRRKALLKQWEKRERLVAEIKKLKSGDQSKGQKDKKKGQNRRMTAEQANQIIKQRERELAKLPEIEAPSKGRKINFSFDDPEHSLPHPVLEVKDVDFKYTSDETSPFIFKGLNFGMDMESRIALVGRNGAGKSTLLNLLAGNLIATVGTVERARKLRIGWFAQHFADALPLELSPVQYLHEKFPEQDVQSLRKALGSFGLPGKRHTQALQTLSGGEKNRVVFASIALSKPHILFLDEPTNHLDMESIVALAEGLELENFGGGVLLVSHDQRLIAAACDKIWIVDNESVEEYHGSIYDYRQELLNEMDLDFDEDE